MRVAHVLWGMALLLTATLPLRGQPPPYQATVRAPEAEVRSGPSFDPQMYVTNRLPSGSVVEVVRELEDGWLAIKPPQGSFSWVNLRHLQRNGNSVYWTVDVPTDTRAEVLIGSPFKPGKPTVVGDRLARGTQVIALGEAREEADGAWLPIRPPDREIRYIRKEQVARMAAAGPASTAAYAGNPAISPGAAKSPLAPPRGSTPPPAPPLPAADLDPDVRAAQQLEEAGRWDEASRACALLAQKYARSDPDRANQYLNHAEWLRRGRPAADPVAADRLRPVASAPSGQGVTPPVVAPAPAAPRPGNVQSVQSSGPGRLRRAGRLIDARRAYYLESAQARVVTYVSEAPGVNLEPYVDRNVELLGRFEPRGDVRPQFMTVVRVIPLP